jgi:hypothetical protein
MKLFGLEMPPQPLVAINAIAGVLLIGTAAQLSEWPIAQAAGVVAGLTCYVLAAVFLRKSLSASSPPD